MSWFYLVLAGLLEVCWVVSLKYSDSFTRLVPSIITVITAVVSVVLFEFAIRELPVAVAYSVWVGIGVVGAMLWGIFVFHEPTSFKHVFFLVLLLVSIIGLKVV